MTRRYGWHPSVDDQRNIRADVAGLPIHQEVDPRGNMPDAYDQGQLGSCTANAYAGAVEYDDILYNGRFGTPSRLAIYYGEREREGTISSDAGAFGHDAFKDGRKYGVAPESLWPYVPSRFADRPPREYLEKRRDHRVLEYRHPYPAIHAFKRVLSNRQTIAFGFSVYESFESLDVERTGIVPLPDPSERMLGGHEVLCVGYLESHPWHALVRNSWGPEWGMGGYCLMPWRMILDGDDWRTIYREAGA